MTDQHRGKYTQGNLFRREWLKAKERLAPLGGTLEPGVHDYEAFVFTAPGVRLVFYPHTTKGTGNRHIRVRATNAADRAMLKRAIFALAENSCTFGFPSEPALHQAGVCAALDRERAALAARYLATKAES